LTFSEVKRFYRIGLLKQFCEIEDNNLYIPFVVFGDGAEVSHVMGYLPLVFLKTQIWDLRTEHRVALLALCV
jgi:hypothetical protein